MSDQVGKLIEKTEKTIKALKDSEGGKTLKSKTDSEAKMALNSPSPWRHSSKRRRRRKQDRKT